jgi:hypothetical protein
MESKSKQECNSILTEAEYFDSSEISKELKLNYNIIGGI